MEDHLLKPRAMTMDPYKYYEYLFSVGTLQEGDIMFTRGTSFMAKSIQLIDRCYYNHVGIVTKLENDIPMVLESLGEGAALTFLNKRISINEDYAFYRIKDTTEAWRKSKLDLLKKEASMGQAGRDYDRKLLLKIAALRTLKLGAFTGKDPQATKDICSELVRRYTDMMGLKIYSKEAMIEKTGAEWITPKDFLQYNDGSLIKIL